MNRFAVPYREITHFLWEDAVWCVAIYYATQISNTRLSRSVSYSQDMLFFKICYVLTDTFVCWLQMIEKFMMFYSDVFSRNAIIGKEWNYSSQFDSSNIHIKRIEYFERRFYDKMEKYRHFSTLWEHIISTCSWTPGVNPSSSDINYLQATTVINYQLIRQT